MWLLQQSNGQESPGENNAVWWNSQSTGPNWTAPVSSKGSSPKEKIQAMFQIAICWWFLFLFLFRGRNKVDIFLGCQGHFPISLILMAQTWRKSIITVLKHCGEPLVCSSSCTHDWWAGVSTVALNFCTYVLSVSVSRPPRASWRSPGEECCWDNGGAQVELWLW